MPADLSISSAAQTGAEPIVPPAREALATTPAAAPSAPTTATQVATPSIAPGPNPTRYFDHASGIVVLQFVSANGTVEQTIPTARQLEAFRHSQAAATQVDSGAATSPASAATSGGSDVVRLSVPTTTTAAPASKS